MRFVSLVAVVVGLGVANAAAQDPFADVTNEPRPSEFIHWDAQSFAGFKSELEDQLREGPGILGTPFAVLNALPGRTIDGTMCRSSIERGTPNPRSTKPGGISTWFWTGREPPCLAASE